MALALKTKADPVDGQAAVRPKPKKRKKSKKKIIFGSVVAIFALIIWALLQPIKGSVKFGICQVFVERTLTYPIEMKVTQVIESGNQVRMDYSTVNEYGEYILSSAECNFKPDPVTTWALTDVQINHDKVPQDKLAIFNSTIPFIISSLPDLTLPDDMVGNLQELKR
jgi:hypothetical protein